MLVDFNTLPEDSRMWIYQADQELSVSAIQELQTEIESFLRSWQAHGKDLRAGYKIEHNRFLIIAVDENGQPATGCSIDSSVAILNKIQSSLNIDFFNRSMIVYAVSGELHYLNLSEFKSAVKCGEIGQDTVIFNNTIVRKGDLDSHWAQPLSESWAARLMPSTAV